MPKKSKPKESQKFLGTLYPDSESYDIEVIKDRIKEYFVEWAFCIHDKDVDENGELKKPHLHWVARRPSDVPISAVSTALELPEHDIEIARNFRSGVRYLIHADSSEKFQYSKDSIESNLEIADFFKADFELKYMQTILDFIYSGNARTINDVLFFSMKAGPSVFSCFRRNWSLINTVLTNYLTMEVPV